MNDSLPLPSPEAIKSVFDRLFNSGHSSTKLRDAALGNRLLPPSTPDAFCVPGRSIAWKLFLSPEEPLQAGPSNLGPSSSLFLDALRIARSTYSNLVLEKFKAPDGTYEEGLQIPGNSKPPGITRKAEDLERNNPLSLAQDNPWTDWYASVDLRKTILQDVERTFPDIAFFREVDVQSQLTNILFLYAITHPDIGYRQGMHEVLAPLYLAVYFDSIVDPDGIQDTILNELCSRTWVAADAWALFDRLMQTMSKWYEWREPSISSTPTDTFTGHGNGPLHIVPYVAPIVQICNRIQSVLLRSVDPVLWRSLQSSGIEPQIYGIRWLRMLFTREFPMAEAMRLWDAIFACDPTLEIAPWICVAMLIRIRNDLIPSDYSEQLTVLLRYPSFAEVDITHTNLLLTQSVALQMAPAPSTGHSLVLENRNRLNINVDVPQPPPPPMRRNSSRAGNGATSHPRPASRTIPQQPTQSHAPRQPSQQGLPEMLARGLLDRGESLGINKTLMSAVSELRRNIPDLNSFGRPPSGVAYPLNNGSENSSDPALDTRHDFEELRSTNRQLGASLGWIVDILLQDESSVSDKTLLSVQRAEALESLSHIRDVLNGSSSVDIGRLIGEKQAAARNLTTKLPKRTAPQLPQPVSVTHSRTRHSPSPSLPTYPGSPQTPYSPAGSRHAPWSHTSSNFSPSDAHSGLPSTSLPRVPPAASTPLAGSRSRTEVQRDPLGAL